MHAFTLLCFLKFFFKYEVTNSIFNFTVIFNVWFCLCDVLFIFMYLVCVIKYLYICDIVTDKFVLIFSVSFF